MVPEKDGKHISEAVLPLILRQRNGRAAINIRAGRISMMMHWETSGRDLIPCALRSKTPSGGCISHTFC